MPFFYRSGEQIERGDQVRLHGEPGKIESVEDHLDNPNNWFVETLGGGVMVVEPKFFGHLLSRLPSATTKTWSSYLEILKARGVRLNDQKKAPAAGRIPPRALTANSTPSYK